MKGAKSKFIITLFSFLLLAIGLLWFKDFVSAQTISSTDLGLAPVGSAIGVGRAVHAHQAAGLGQQAGRNALRHLIPQHPQRESNVVPAQVAEAAERLQFAHDDAAHALDAREIHRAAVDVDERLEQRDGAFLLRCGRGDDPLLVA